MNAWEICEACGNYLIGYRCICGHDLIGINKTLQTKNQEIELLGDYNIAKYEEEE